ncbi:MAG: beta-propeller fold lactonase family protein [Saprospiraceae bacterium]|nr:beta-propeller fold lactonase family protein [Saprospiraceae bacterium]
MRLPTTILASLLLFAGSTAQIPLDQAEGDPFSFETDRSHAPVLPKVADQSRLELQSLAAGDQPEGDYLGEVAFSGDGKWVLATNRTTDNLTVFDWNTKAIVADIPLGQQPVALAAGDQYAVVACYSSDEAYIVDLSDFSVAAVIPTASQPATVRLSRDQQLAFVGCDEADLCEVIDLSTLTKSLSIPDFPVYLYKFSFITNGPRNSVYWSGFAVAPDNSYLANGAGGEGIVFYDLSDGQAFDTLLAVADSPQLAVSGDGSKLIAVEYGSAGVVSQIDAADRSLLAQVALPANLSIFSTYSEPATNFDGSKAYVSLSGNQSAMVRFNTADYSLLASAGSPNWVAPSPDYQYVVHGGYYLSIVDFATETIVSQNAGRPIAWGAVSAAQNRLVASDPLRYEGYHFYNYVNPNSLSYETSKPTGSELEADNTYSVAIAPDGKTAVAINSLSQTASVVDLEQGELKGIVPLQNSEAYFAAITPDSRYALVPLRTNNQVAVIDLQTFELVQITSSGGSNPDLIRMHPDGTRAYVLNAGSSDVIGVIAVDGANSFLQQVIDVGNMGVSWTNFGLRSDLAIHPGGELALLAASFDDELQVISLESNTVVQTVDLPGFPLQIAISDDGFWAVVTLKNAAAIALLAIGNGTVTLEDTFPTGANPTRVSYDPATARFAVCSNDERRIEYFDPNELQFGTPSDAPDDYTPLAAVYGPAGGELQLLRSDNADLPHYLLFEGAAYFELPALPIHYSDRSTDGRYAVFCHPGSDQISVFSFVIEHLQTLSLQLPWTYTVSPMPFAERVHFYSPDASGDQVDLILYDRSGKRVLKQDGLPAGNFSLPRAQLPAGSYFYQIHLHGRLMAVGQLIAQ